MSESLYNPASLTVMIVDDHDPIRKALKRLLLSLGFADIIECSGGGDAIKIIAKRPVDLVITDLYMRKVSGFDLLEHVRNREIGSDVPIIVVTGEGSKEEIVKVAAMGADDYVLKPFQALDIERKIVSTLSKYYSPSPMVRALRKAERTFLSGDLARAVTEYDAALAIDPASARAAHGKAITLDRLGRPDDAIAILRHSISINHSYHRNYGALADILVRKNLIKEGIEAMKRELEINPKQPNRQVQLAKMLLKEGDALGAVEHYRITLQDDPRRLGALMGMGHAYALANNLDKALYYFKRVRRYHPTATKALESAVRCAVAGGEPKRAEMFLRDERAAHPDRLDATELLAEFYIRHDRAEEALAIIEDLLTRQPDNTMALLLRAKVSFQRGNHATAAADLEQVVKVAPTAEILTMLGETYLRLSKVTEAIDTLQRSIALNPNNPYAFLLMADAHKSTEQFIKAVALYRRAAQLGSRVDRIQTDIRACLNGVQQRRMLPRAAS